MVELSIKKGRSFLATCVCHTPTLFLFCVGHSNPCRHNRGINILSKVKCQMVSSHRQSLKMGSTCQGFLQEIKAEDKRSQGRREKIPMAPLVPEASATGPGQIWGLPRGTPGATDGKNGQDQLVESQQQKLNGCCLSSV